jgi:hypothetical protein
MIFRSSKTASQSKAKGARQETPFEKRRREISELESKLKADAERAERFIKTAPQIAAERQKEQREAYLSNAVSPGARGNIRLPDSRYLAADAVAAPRTRRRDRKEGKWVFFLLVMALFAAAWWAWQTLFQTAF